MLLSKINSLAHLRAAPCNDLHATKLAPGECLPPFQPHPGRAGLWGVGGEWDARQEGPTPAWDARAECPVPLSLFPQAKRRSPWSRSTRWARCWAAVASARSTRASASPTTCR